MASSDRGIGGPQTLAGVLIVGLIAVPLGVFLLGFPVPEVGTLSAFSSVGVFGHSLGTEVDDALFSSLLVLYNGGLLTVGAGGIMIAIGSLSIGGQAR